LTRSLTLHRPKAEFSGFAQGDGLVTPPDFVSMIGTLLPVAPCGRSSLEYLRQASNFLAASASVRNQGWFRTYNNDRPNMGIGGVTPAQKLKMAA
jgi:hypothetical protein